MILKLKQDCVNLSEKLYCPEEEEQEKRPALKKRRHAEDIKEALAAKTKQVLCLLDNRMTCQRFRDTVVGAASLVSKLRNTEPGPEGLPDEIEDLLVTRYALQRHILLLDGAVDRVNSDLIYEHRLKGRFAGVALATDESPPSQPRFRGLRFQITVFYYGTFRPLHEWESAEAPPLDLTATLGDILHSPGKKGIDVSNIIQKQLARLGMNCYDVVSCTGDGGMENEGREGIHAHFETLSPGYVRRRCLPHISWRTCDMAIRTSELDFKALCAYLTEGVTWFRLRQIGVQPPAQHGLGLFRDSSRACMAIFGSSPAALVSTRPETDLRFLRLLRGKEDVLYRLASKDLEQRPDLKDETKAAVASLGNIRSRIKRSILCEVLERSMFLYHWNGKHGKVATRTSWDELLNRAQDIIMNLGIDSYTLARFRTSADDLEAMGPDRPQTWVALAVLEVVGQADLVAEYLDEALNFCRVVSESAATHLALISENTYRTPWLSAKLLSPDAVLAQDSAKALLRHLDTTKPVNRSSFENHLIDSPELWLNLEAFARADVPMPVWKGNGKYECLFKFLAPRFLMAPDHVLDAERVHARWQWSCHQKRSLKLQALNASLRLIHFQENNQCFPTDDVLGPELEAEARDHKLALEALHEEDEVALGHRYLL